MGDTVGILTYPLTKGMIFFNADLLNGYRRKTGSCGLPKNFVDFSFRCTVVLRDLVNTLQMPSADRSHGP
jgi:hypothetical protein